MARKIIQDIFVKNKNIRPVYKNENKISEVLKTPEKPVASVNIKKRGKISFPEKIYSHEAKDDKDKKISKNSRIFLWSVCVASVAILLFFLSSFFATAKVTITPKTEALAMNNSYTISLKKEIAGLHYEIMTVKKTLSKPIETDGEESVERKAIGKVILYNNFSTSNQKLINNTRLQSADGRIYRIRESVEIPGIKTINGIKTPGNIEVEAIADEAGDKYNMKISDFKGDFTIPGFKGNPKYSGFYGRLSQDMSGGIIGKVKKVSETALSTGREELKNNLKAELIKEAYSQKPDQYVVFKNNYYIETNDLPDSSEDKDYNINEDGTIYSIIFNENELSAFLAKNKLKSFDGSKVDLLWDDNFSADISGKTEKPWKEDSLKVTFSGNMNLVYSYDKDEIINEISGKNKSVLKDILENNKNSITEIKAEIKPSWKNSFPKNSNKIKMADSVRDIANK